MNQIYFYSLFFSNYRMLILITLKYLTSINQIFEMPIIFILYFIQQQNTIYFILLFILIKLSLKSLPLIAIYFLLTQSQHPITILLCQSIFTIQLIKKININHQVEIGLVSCCVFAYIAFMDGLFHMLWKHIGWNIVGRVLVIILMIAVIYIIKDRMNEYKPIKRKIFHLPLLFFLLGRQDPFMLQTQLIGIYYIFYILQFIRSRKQLGMFIQCLEKFVDERDQKQWNTHLALIMGVCYPYIVYKQMVGLLIIMADAGACFFGFLWGKTKFPGTHKTIIGFCAYQLICILGFLLTNQYNIIALFITGIFQLYVSIDNLFLPMLYYSLIDLNLF